MGGKIAQWKIVVVWDLLLFWNCRYGKGIWGGRCVSPSSSKSEKDQSKKEILFALAIYTTLQLPKEESCLSSKPHLLGKR